MIFRNFAAALSVAMLASAAPAAASESLGAGEPLAAGVDAAGTDSTDRDRALQCLGTAIAYEAGYEPVEGQQAVAEVILNRTRHPAYPKTVCGVVFAGSERRTGCQFTFTCDGSLGRRLPDAVLAASRRVAEMVLDGAAPDRIGLATHYHADYVTPYWAPSLIRVTKIGAHIFYRLPGSEATLASLAASGEEPEIAALAAITGRRSSHSASPPARPPATVFAPWGLQPVRNSF